jgi:hypothetical protein
MRSVLPRLTLATDDGSNHTLWQSQKVVGGAGRPTIGQPACRASYWKQLMQATVPRESNPVTGARAFGT